MQQLGENLESNRSDRSVWDGCDVSELLGHKAGSFLLGL